MRGYEDDDTMERVTGQPGVTLLLFGAPPCPPCRMLRRKIEAWQETHPGIPAVYVSVGRYLADAAQHGILSAPAIQVYRDGKLWIERVGTFSLEDVLSAMESIA